ncbi:hypothetical protein GCM10010495_10090 [Kitasatospora herbaricolor]|nr:hypothetical protein GCM10010495_10090 [Kitasatospora herbaricolor]
MPAALVRQALQDPALLARCVPGLSTEPAAAGSGQAEEISGRLRLRIGTSTITYRGVLSLIEGREGVLTAFAEGQEARGSGEATATVRIAVRPGGAADGADGGAEAGADSATATVRFTGDLSATGRLDEFDAETLAATGRRLLDRFAAALASAGDGLPEEDEGEEAEEEAAEGPGATVLFLEDRAQAAEDGEDAATGGNEGEDGSAGAAGAAAAADAAFEEAFDGDSLDDDLSDLIAFSDADAERFGLPTGGEQETGQPADASADLPYDYDQDQALTGPVRRSIVGRSAEEVDHAPPRGRYAPALPARSARARAASRWGGDAGGAVPGGRAAVPWMIGGGVALLGGAVVLVRVLRRR